MSGMEYWGFPVVHTQATAVITTDVIGDNVARASAKVDLFKIYADLAVGATTSDHDRNVSVYTAAFLTELTAVGYLRIDAQTKPHTAIGGCLDINLRTSTNSGISGIDTVMTTHNLGNGDWAYNFTGSYDSRLAVTPQSSVAVIYLSTPQTNMEIVNCLDYGIYICAGYDFGIASLSPVVLSTLTIAPAADPTPYPLNFQLEGWIIPGVGTPGVYSQGRVVNMTYGAARTLDGALYGVYMDFISNVTHGSQQVTGIYIAVPDTDFAYTPFTSSASVLYADARNTQGPVVLVEVRNSVGDILDLGPSANISLTGNWKGICLSDDPTRKLTLGAGDAYGISVEMGNSVIGGGGHFYSFYADTVPGEYALTLSAGRIHWMPQTGDYFLIEPGAPIPTASLIDVDMAAGFTSGTILRAYFSAVTAALTGTLLGVNMDMATNLTDASGQTVVGYYARIPANVSNASYGIHVTHLGVQGSGMFSQMMGTVAASNTLKGAEIRADSVTLNDAGAIYYGMHIKQSAMTLTSYATEYGLFIEMPATYGAGSDAAIYATGDGLTWSCILGDQVMNIIADRTGVNNVETILAVSHDLTSSASKTHTGKFIDYTMVLTSTSGQVERKTNPIIDLAVSLSGAQAYLESGFIRMSVSGISGTSRLKGFNYLEMSTNNSVIQDAGSINGIYMNFNHNTSNQTLRGIFISSGLTTGNLGSDCSLIRTADNKVDGNVAMRHIDAERSLSGDLTGTRQVSQYLALLNSNIRNQTTGDFNIQESNSFGLRIFMTHSVESTGTHTGSDTVSQMKGLDLELAFSTNNATNALDVNQTNAMYVTSGFTGQTGTVLNIEPFDNAVIEMDVGGDGILVNPGGSGDMNLLKVLAELTISSGTQFVNSTIVSGLKIDANPVNFGADPNATLYGLRIVMPDDYSTTGGGASNAAVWGIGNGNTFGALAYTAALGGMGVYVDMQEASSTGAFIVADASDLDNNKYGIQISKDLSITTAATAGRTINNQALNIQQILANLNDDAAGYSITSGNLVNALTLSHEMNTTAATNDSNTSTLLELDVSAETMAATDTLDFSPSALVIGYVTTHDAGILNLNATNIFRLNASIGTGTAVAGNFNAQWINLGGFVPGTTPGAGVIATGLNITWNGATITNHANWAMYGAEITMPASYLAAPTYAAIYATGNTNTFSALTNLYGIYINTPLDTMTGMYVCVDSVPDAANSKVGILITKQLSNTTGAPLAMTNSVVDLEVNMNNLNGGSTIDFNDYFMDMEYNANQADAQNKFSGGFLNMVTNAIAGTLSIEGEMVSMLIRGKQSSGLDGMLLDFDHDVNSQGFSGIELSFDGITNTGAGATAYGMYLHDTSGNIAAMLNILMASGAVYTRFDLSAGQLIELQTVNSSTNTGKVLDRALNLQEIFMDCLQGESISDGVAISGAELAATVTGVVAGAVAEGALTHKPDVPRNMTIVVTTDGGGAIAGNVVISGTLSDGAADTETIPVDTPLGQTKIRYHGNKAFIRVTGITYPATNQGGNIQQLWFSFGNKLGLANQIQNESVDTDVYHVKKNNANLDSSDYLTSKRYGTVDLAQAGVNQITAGDDITVWYRAHTGVRD